MCRLKPILLFIYFNLSLILAAQQQSFIKYTVYDGMVANPVFCVYQDTKGYIWIGTYDGLSRYDGYKFTNYTTANGLSHNLINDIVEAPDGNLLVSENNGTIDVIQNNVLLKKSLKAASPLNFFGLHNNRLLISSDRNGFYEYKNDSLVSPSQRKIDSSIGHFISLNDTFLLSDAIDYELVLRKKDFTIEASLKYPVIHFYSLLQDSKKRIWACTSTGLKLVHISTGEKKGLSFAPLPAEFNFSPLNDAPVSAMIEEQDGSFWIGYSKGLLHLLPDGSFYVYNEKDGLPSATINSLYFDREKNLWIGTMLGLAKWVAKNNVTFYNREEREFKNDVYSVSYLKNNKVLLFTTHGLQQFDVNTKEIKDIKLRNPELTVPLQGSSPLLILYRDNPYVDKTLADRIGMIDTITKTITPSQKLDTIISSVSASITHPDGTIFLGTFYGLVSIKNGRVEKILPHRITSLAIDKAGGVWAGTWLDGLYRLTSKPGKESGYTIQDITYLVKEKLIRGLYTDSKKNMWVGTRYSGAFCLTEKANSNFSILHFNRQSGLMSDWIYCFAETSAGDMWVGNYQGLDKLVKEPAGYRVFNFSRAVNFFAQVKQMIPIGNNEWVCSANNGFAYFKDEKLHQTPPLPASLFSASLGAGDDKLTIFSPSEKIFLKPKQNAARFEFGALGFMNERQILYSYRLKGISDTSWSSPANIHEASYESLSSGSYTFEVKTLGWNGEYSEPAAFSFHIKTPFWKQWWFISIGALLAIALVYSLYRYRIKQIIKLQQVRNTIATDLHDDIGSALTNISILAELSRNKNQQNAFAENLPGRISEESMLAQQALDDIIWSVNSNNDTLNQTMARMRRYVAEVFEPIGINCKIDFESIPGDHKLNMEQRKDIYLVFKECLNNTIKHAGAKNVFIKIDLQRNLFNLKIEDDGKGFDPSKQTDRNGVKNIRERVQRWNGKLTIHSTTGEGTTVDCSFPLASPK